MTSQEDVRIIMIENRNYDSWTIHKMETMELVEDKRVDPTHHKLFSMDVFTVSSPEPSDENQKKKLVLKRSPVRNAEYISGVLVLKHNRSYGRIHGNGNLLYKCIPDDKRIPVFLIPYEIRKIGFMKSVINKYVTFQFKSWTDKHPIGTLTNVIGNVDILDNYYEYQLYCKSLNASIQIFTQDTRRMVNNKKAGREEHDIMMDINNAFKDVDKGIEDRTGFNIYTIDPTESTDFDDAVGHTCYTDDTSGLVVTKLSIYISNVTLLLDYLGIWSSFSNRVSTIYLPDRKRPMLPTILSDGLCSLVEDKVRFALALDIHILKGEILKIDYTNTMIRVSKNYRYEEKDLLNLDDYKTVVEVARSLLPKYQYVSCLKNSHDIIAYLMILMNYETAKLMLTHGNGIFRNVIAERIMEQPIPSDLDPDVKMFLKSWNSGAAQYIDIAHLDEGTVIRHDILEMDAYLHITSPIRRLADLMNMIRIQSNIGLVTLSDAAYDFYAEWSGKLGYINSTMQSIRKVQNECALIHKVYSDEILLQQEYIGYIFDKVDRKGIWQYNVYIPQLKWMSKLTSCNDMENYTKHTLRIHMFHDEDSVKRKIRVSLVE